MSIPHRGGLGTRSRARCMSVTTVVEEKIAPWKRASFEFPRGTCECAAEVIVRVRVLSRKTRTAAAQDGCDLWSGRATEEQFLGDPLIGDAPVGLRKTFQNPQSVQPTGIDSGGGSGRRRDSRVGVRVGVGGPCESQAWELRPVRWAVQIVPGRFQQSGGLRSQAAAGVEHLHPRRVTAPVAPLWFLIGEAGQSAEMTPIGTGRVAAVDVGQLFPDPAGHSGFDGRGADLDPSLEIAGAGLEYDTGIVPIPPHRFHSGGAGGSRSTRI